MAINLTNTAFTRNAAARAAAIQQQQQSSQNQAGTISVQMGVEARKSQTSRAAIVSDTATRVFQMHQQASVNAARSADVIHNRILQLMAR